MKKKYALALAAVLLAGAVLTGGSLAATSASGQAATEDLAAPKLQVSIGQSSSGQLSVSSPKENLMPGDSLGSAGFTVENTADVSLYARVTVTKYWTDGGETKNNTTMSAGTIDMTLTSSSWLQAEEVLSGNSGETEVYYYAIPLQPGQSADLDLDLLLDSSLTNGYQGAGVTLTAQVDAVQYVAGENELNASGILATFGVVATLNADGSIQSVTQ